MYSATVKQFRKPDLVSRIIKLAIKMGLNTILLIKLLQLVNISGHRFEQQNAMLLLLESKLIKLNEMRQRVDYLFSLNSELYVLREHKEWIENNRLRIIWTTTAPFPSVE